jgi:hypothetical protein
LRLRWEEGVEGESGLEVGLGSEERVGISVDGGGSGREEGVELEGGREGIWLAEERANCPAKDVVVMVVKARVWIAIAEARLVPPQPAAGIHELGLVFPSQHLPPEPRRVLPMTVSDPALDLLQSRKLLGNLAPVLDDLLFQRSEGLVAMDRGTVEEVELIEEVALIEEEVEPSVVVIGGGQGDGRSEEVVSSAVIFGAEGKGEVGPLDGEPEVVESDRKFRKRGKGLSGEDRGERREPIKCNAELDTLSEERYALLASVRYSRSSKRSCRESPGRD